MLEDAFSRYERDPKLAIFSALSIANRLGASEITPEHLLLGATVRQHAPECGFRRLKEQADALKEQVGLTELDLAGLKPMTHPQLPLSARSKRVLAGTQLEADALGHYWIDIDHLILGLLQGGGSAAQALLAQGWRPDTVRQTASAARQRYRQRRVPFFRGLLFRYRVSRRTVLRYVPVLLTLALLAGILFLHRQASS